MGQPMGPTRPPRGVLARCPGATCSAGQLLELRSVKQSGQLENARTTAAEPQPKPWCTCTRMRRHSSVAQHQNGQWQGENKDSALAAKKSDADGY
mmetsp:Transcript_23574/g.60256  ORF Transcript_23574/g.60256 Transcript_23574/m.60256 type:complete len:95 (-) Transcript_23574:2389-2673(-)